MNPQEIEKLLGGYATDTLTEEERRTLFEAALGNQSLFDALADEQALRELLDDPPSRAQLLATLREERQLPLWSRILAWMRQPSALALAAAVAAGIVTIAVVIPHKTLEKPATVAMKQTPAPERQPVPLQAEQDSVPAPKPAAAAPSGSPPRSALLRRPELDPQAVLRRDSRTSGRVTATRQSAPMAAPVETAAAPAPTPVVAAPAEPQPAAAAPPPPPPPPPAQTAASTAKSQFKAAEELQVRAQPGVVGGVAPGGAGGAVPETRKKEAAPSGARDLYYAAQVSTANSLMDANKPAAKAKSGAFGGGLSVQRAATSPGAVIGGVRYSILRRNLDASFVEVDPSTIFVPGDALRVRFETNQPGNLAVMERQADGKWTLRMAAHTQPGQPVYMPPESTIDVKAAGTFRFFVRFSRSLRNDARLEQVAATPNVLRESAANSVYVVNPTAATDPQVDFELAINAR